MGTAVSYSDPTAISESRRLTRLGPQRMKLLTACAICLSLLLGCSALSVVSKAPPAGEIWFGRSFDTTTFEVRDRITETSKAQEFALVASFPRMVEQNIRFELVQFGIVVYEEVIPLAQPANVYGVVIRPSVNLFPATGLYAFRFRDGGGSDLALGTLTVT